MDRLADLIGEHALVALSIFSLLLLLATWILWRIIERFGDALWRTAARLWRFLASSALGQQLRRVPLLHASLTRTMSAWRYLGLHAVASFVVALAALSGFVELADEIGADEELGAFDERLAASLRANVGEATLEAFASITHLGDRDWTIALGALIAVYFCVRRWWLHAVVWVVGTGGGGLLIQLLKNQFERTRPIHEHALTDTSSWSFPSGHAAGAMLVYGMLGYFVVRHTSSVWHIPIALAMLTLIVFVGFSRVILQVHYLSDVLAGFAVAGAWTALWIAAFEVVRRRNRVMR